MTQVTAIVVNFNGRHFLAQCLTCLRDQTLEFHRIIVVDNGSSDGSVEWLKRYFPEIEVWALSQNLGFCRANNLALADVMTEYVVLVNNDAFLAPTWLGHMVEVLEKDAGAGAAVGKMLFFDRPDLIDRAGDDYTRAGAPLMRGRFRPAHEFNWSGEVLGASAAAVVYRLEMLRDIGLFDEAFFMVHEDVDLSLRARLAGWRILYQPAAQALHHGGGTFKRLPDTAVYYGHRNLEWVFWGNLPAGLIRRALPTHVLLVFFAWAGFVAQGQGRVFLKAKWNALKGLPRVWSQRRYRLRKHRVSDQELWDLMAPEKLLQRLGAKFRDHKRRQLSREADLGSHAS